MKGLNSAYEETTRLVPKMVPSDAPLGRLAGWLAKDWGRLEAPMLDLSVGVVIDVGIQGISDLGMLWRGDLTLPQYGGRLGVEAFGSGLSWLAGTATVSLLGFSGPVGVGVAIVASTLFDVFLKPGIYDWLNLNPRTHRSLIFQRVT